MKTIKKLALVAMAAVLATVSFVPSTFSWYTHSDKSEGSKIRYTGELPVSIKSGANTVTMKTVESDADGNAGTTQVDTISIPADTVTFQAMKYYRTTFTNTGTNDVFVDLETSDLPNNADFYIGTVSPTLNEKAYASRPVRTKVSDTTVRVYFKPHTDMSSYWSVDNGRLKPESGTYNVTNGQVIAAGWEAGSSNQTNDNSGTTNDINLSYTVDGKEYQVKMSKCVKNSSDSVDTNWSSTGTRVYYYDIPTNADKFFFFNHWYLKSGTNREWNRTIDITDLSPGKLYYLTNNKVDDKWKEYAVKTVDTNLVAVNQYYSFVRMSLGASVFADISLKKESANDDEDFVPEYYGATISYQSSDTSKATVSKDGVITPIATTTNNSNVDTPITITTTITGTFGDSRQIATSVSIPKSISQVPIIKNVKVPAGESVDVDWYAINRSNKSDATMSTSSIFFTI